MDVPEPDLEVLAMVCRLLSVFIMLCLVSAGAAAAESQTFIAISYHDVRDDVVDDLDPDRVAVGTLNLISQFSWLREHGYHPVSLNDILAAQQGKHELPDKAVLLTFDDGLESVYTRVFPLLKMFKYPAVIAIMGRWLEAGPAEKIEYGNKVMERNQFLTWEQVREMVGSGLVEVASHSYDLHRAVQGNPQGNAQPIIVTRELDIKSQAYESLAQHRKLLRDDMQAMVSLLEKRVGVKPRCMVWPYGLDNSMAMEEAKTAGFQITMVLGGRVNHTDDVSRIYRILIETNPELEDFMWILRNFYKTQDPIRVTHVDLDYIYDPDKDQEKRNLDLLLERIKTMKINTVYLQAFADADGNGVAEAMYFPNRHMPVREDLFNRVAWQLRTRAGVNVYAWMPVLAFELEDKELTQRLLVRKSENGAVSVCDDCYRRLSPFSPDARRIIGEIYEDLASHAFFTGLLFHDDAYLSDFEDAGPDAMRTYAQEWGISGDLESIRRDKALFQRWSRLKTETLAGFTDELIQRVKRFRPDIKTSRNIYAMAALDPEAEEWLAQSMDIFLKHYDYTALMAMPYMEKASNPEQWLRDLVKAVEQHEGGLRKTVFELQSIKWSPDNKLPTRLLTNQMRMLQGLGAVNFGYYPDDFVTDHPKLMDIKSGISLENYPYIKGP